MSKRYKTVIIVEDTNNNPQVYVWNEVTDNFDLAQNWEVVSEGSEVPHEQPFDLANWFDAPDNIRSYGGLYYLVKMQA